MNMTDRASISSRLGELILIRLSAAGESPTLTVLDKDLARYFTEGLAMPCNEWRDTLASVCTTMRAQQWITASPFRLTELGRREATRRLAELATVDRRGWSALRTRHLIAKALGIRPRSSTEWERLAKADGLRAAALSKYYHLPISSVPTIPQALNALAWHYVAQPISRTLPSDRMFSRNTLLCELLLDGKRLNDLAAGLAARIYNIPNTNAELLRDAIIVAWITSEASEEPAVGEFSLVAFAATINRIARDAKSGRHGDHKVFISHVWQQYSQDPSSPPMTRDEFNQRLIEANRSTLLTLSRADLICAMAPEDVSHSEVPLSDTTVHFVRSDFPVADVPNAS